MSEIRKSLEENSKVQENKEDQLIPNPNEISEPYQYQNYTEDKTNQQNKFSIPPPFVNNENNQQKIEINQKNFRIIKLIIIIIIHIQIIKWIANQIFHQIMIYKSDKMLSLVVVL